MGNIPRVAVQEQHRAARPWCGDVPAVQAGTVGGFEKEVFVRQTDFAGCGDQRAPSFRIEHQMRLENKQPQYTELGSGLDRSRNGVTRNARNEMQNEMQNEMGSKTQNEMGSGLDMTLFLP